ncbi:hypothetical protein [Sphingobacterium zeae]|uniref:Uncharacterized protein n=1 Tax=Sphingobacterium zeae TaxID=1776859 RepID=A0ABU0U699_9SPHI|nr:hypothetical protein [Sphingobacterium zeae]MDQ1150485.1 hypothetical protein [Sphingobacterium zeae]
MPGILVSLVILVWLVITLMLLGGGSKIGHGQAMLVQIKEQYRMD